jgi:hypothetical protein
LLILQVRFYKAHANIRLRRRSPRMSAVQDDRSGLDAPRGPLRTRFRHDGVRDALLDTLLDRPESGVATTQFQLGTPARELQSVLKGGLP